MYEVKTGAEEQKAELVSGREFDTKDASKKRKFGSTKKERKKETKEQNGCLDIEEEEEGEQRG